MTDLVTDSERKDSSFPTTTRPGSESRWGLFLLDVFSPSADSTHQYPYLLLSWRAACAEWLFIAAGVVAYSYRILGLGNERVLPGFEEQIARSVQSVLATALTTYGQFPLWNAYMYSGFPFVGDPSLNIFNPLITLPVLVFGLLDGFRIAVFLSFVAAGIGMWWLGAFLGLGRVGRIWVALMYAFAGPEAAKFIQGQYWFVLAFAWLPWSLGFTIATVRWRRRSHLVAAALSLSLLYFSGCAYYSYYMLFAMAVFVFAVCLNFSTTSPFVSVRWPQLLTVASIGLLALGVVAIQLLPNLEFWPRIIKGLNLDLKDSHTLSEVIFDFLSPDPFRPDVLRPWHRPEDYYAYTGVWPFFALLLIPLAHRQRERRLVLFLAGLFVFSVLFAAMRDMPWRNLYTTLPWLYQFRFPTRILILGDLALIALGGLGVDSFVRWMRSAGRTHTGSPAATSRVALPVLVMLFGVFVVVSVVDVYRTNSQLVTAQSRNSEMDELMAWLREHDPSEYYFSAPGDWYADITAHRIRYYDAHYPFSEPRSQEGSINSRPVKARPKYMLGGKERPPDRPDAVLTQHFPLHSIWQLTSSLPFAFGVSTQKLMDPADRRELQVGEVVALQATPTGPNSLLVTADGDDKSTLVVLSAWSPGWEVTVDGQRQQLKKVSGYLATDLKEGKHAYSFEYRSMPFAVGLIVSLFSLGVCLGLLVYSPLVALFAKPPTLRRLRSALSAFSAPLRGQHEPLTGRSLESKYSVSSDGWYGIGVYRKGSIELDHPPEIPNSSRVRVYMESCEACPLEAPLVPAASPTVDPRAVRLRLLDVVRSVRWEWVLFGFGLAVYAFTRLWALEQFPIYFFADEAWFALTAEDLLRHGLHNAQGELLPIYFADGGRWTPALAVYPHVLTLALFGKSILVVRATSVLISLFGSAAVGLILKLVFRLRYWWLGILFMAVIPVWFLHSRTAFETVTMVSFYAWFLLCYFLYRTRSPRFLFPALLFAGAAFYSYSNGQATVAATGLMLFFSDLRYHLRQWRTLLVALLLAAAIAAPLVAFQVNHASGLSDTLRNINSPIAKPIPLQEKVAFYAQNYWTGISPQYWFFPNSRDLVRHRMAGWGQVPMETLPLFILGLGLCLWKARSSPHRTVVIAGLAAPAGAALLEIGAPRVLAFVVPAAILITLGWDLLLRRVPLKVPQGWLSAISFLILAGASLFLLNRSLTEGPLWFKDYGLYGMQYGAKQVFQEAIPELLAANPNTKVMVSPVWANATDRFPRFFLNSGQLGRVQMQNLDYFVSAKRDLDSNTVLVMTPPEYEKARSSPLFKEVRVERILTYPDGSPGFYFARLTYADDINAKMAADQEFRRQLVEGQVQIGDQAVRVRHSRLDAGQLRDMFDGDRHTLARGAEANPFVLELYFPEPRPVRELAIDVNSMDVALTASLFAKDGSQPSTSSMDLHNVSTEPHLVLNFDGAPVVTSMRIEIKNLLAGERANVHVYEVALR